MECLARPMTSELHAGSFLAVNCSCLAEFHGTSCQCHGLLIADRPGWPLIIVGSLSMAGAGVVWIGCRPGSIGNQWAQLIHAIFVLQLKHFSCCLSWWCSRIDDIDDDFCFFSVYKLVIGDDSCAASEPALRRILPGLMVCPRFLFWVYPIA